MNLFKSFGNRYIHVLSSSGPVKERTWTQEIDEPYRTGDTLVLRLPRTKFTFCVGKWSDTTLSESMALQRAIGARAIDVDTEKVRDW